MTLSHRPVRETLGDPVAGSNTRLSLDNSVGLVAVALAVLTAVPVEPVKLQLGTVVCLALLPVVIRDAARDVRLRLLVIALLLWAVGQLLADEVNGLGLNLSAPILLVVVILATVPTLVYLAQGSFRNIRLLIVGVATGLLFWEVLFERSPVTDPTSWKFGFNVPVSVALLALADLAWRRGSRGPSVLVLLALVGLGFWSDHRGLAGIAVLTLIFVFIAPRRRKNQHPKASAALGVVMLILGALSILFIDSAQAGLLGDRSNLQVQRFGSNPMSLLVNVRPELFQELGLFLERPLTGFGSKPRLSSEDYSRSLQFVADVGVTEVDVHGQNWRHSTTPGVSAHSMATDSWARAGILAVPFWIIVVVLALWAGTAALRFRSSPLVIMWTMLALWDVFFSPLPAAAAVYLAAYLALCLVTISNPDASER